MCMHPKSFQSYLALCDPMNCSPPGSSVQGFYRQEYQSGLPCPPPADLPDPGIEPVFLCLLHQQMYFLPLVPHGKPSKYIQLNSKVGFPGYLAVRNLPAIQETAFNVGDAVSVLDWKDPLDEEMATHSSILAWKNPMDRGVRWAAVHGVARVRHDLATKPPP